MEHHLLHPAQTPALRKLFASLRGESPFYRARLDKAGVGEGVAPLTMLDRCPVLTPSDYAAFERDVFERVATTSFLSDLSSGTTRST